MSDLAGWLESIGLGQYADVFSENDIDREILGELGEADLEKLGIGSLGHRKKLLKAIAALASTPASNLAESSTPGQAERRQLTVMFVDLVGSTALSGQLDPEELRELILGYQNTVVGEITRFEGHIARFMGDGVLAYFGWPRAHEDEAERAVRAGLGVTTAVAKLATPAGEALAARVGIATGLVVVGDLIGEGAAREEAVVGETPNLAARLQALAAPGSVVIGPGTRQLLGELFELAGLGAQRFKGFVEPMRAWRVIGTGQAENRFDALHGTRMIPLIGREHELSLLLDRWRLAKGGEGQVVLLAGEPGIGKSRLTRALLEEMAAEPHTRLRYYCSPYHTHSALHPMIEQLMHAAGFATDDSTDAKLDKLEAMLGRSSARVAEATPLLAALLSITSDGRYPPLKLTPQAQKAKTFDALLVQLEGLAANQPVLMVLEDAHWIDPSTGELFGQVIERLARLPVLLVITFRPEFTPPWSGYAHVVSLTLSRLGQRQGVLIVEHLSGGKTLPPEVMEQILAKTDGVPLYVEELTKTVLESGLMYETVDAFVLSGPLLPLAIPTTLHDSLLARLDRLSSVRKVAQIGAVIGREFMFRLLAAVAEQSKDQLDAALARLVSAEIVFSYGDAPDSRYVFKHALVQQAAYQSLLKSKRQTLHARIASVMEYDSRHASHDQPELLGHHLNEAGEHERAIGYWRVAAQRASERSAHREAVGHYRKSLDALEGLAPAPGRDRLQLELLIGLGSALLIVHGYAATAAEEVYGQARELAQKLGEPKLLFAATWGLWMVNLTRLKLTTGRALAEEMQALAEQDSDAELKLQAHHAAWTTLFCVPELLSCRRHAEEGASLYDRHRHRTHKFLYGGHDPGVCGLTHLAMTQWLLGFPDQALENAKRGLELARSLEHAPSLIAALSNGAYVYRFRGETDKMRERLEEEFRLCEEQSIAPQQAAYAQIGLGWALAMSGNVERGLKETRHGLERLLGSAVQFRRAYHLALFAEVCSIAGQYVEGLDALDAALRSSERYWEPELHRLRGKLLLARSADQTSEAEHCFERALAVARSRQARSLELRAAISLARLWAEQGKRQQARDLLAPVYGWFTEGFDTADIKDAKALLATLERAQ